jgi:hypothetical protein
MKNNSITNSTLQELGKKIIDNKTKESLNPQKSPITNQAIRAMLRR